MHLPSKQGKRFDSDDALLNAFVAQRLVRGLAKAQIWVRFPAFAHGVLLRQPASFGLHSLLSGESARHGLTAWHQAVLVSQGPLRHPF